MFKHFSFRSLLNRLKPRTRINAAAILGAATAVAGYLSNNLDGHAKIVAGIAATILGAAATTGAVKANSPSPTPPGADGAN